MPRCSCPPALPARRRPPTRSPAGNASSPAYRDPTPAWQVGRAVSARTSPSSSMVMAWPLLARFQLIWIGQFQRPTVGLVGPVRPVGAWSSISKVSPSMITRTSAPSASWRIARMFLCGWCGELRRGKVPRVELPSGRSIVQGRPAQAARSGAAPRTRSGWSGKCCPPGQPSRSGPVR